MRYRRRRRPRVQWLPVPGTQLANQAANAPLEPRENPGQIEFAVDPQVNEPQTISAPMVVDQPTSEVFTGATLDVWRESGLNQSNEFGYRLRRIVGDYFCTAAQRNDQVTNSGAVLCAAGIMVRRVGETGLADGNAAGQDVGSIQNNADPYVWRRTWVLQEGAAGSQTFRNMIQFPSSVNAYGTKWHQTIDQKTMRRVGPEERLFFTFTVWGLPLDSNVLGSSPDGYPTIYFLMDYRVLGTVFTAAGNRNNSNR